jgi:hypothetical protein
VIDKNQGTLPTNSLNPNNKNNYCGHSSFVGRKNCPGLQIKNDLTSKKNLPNGEV